jgi:hypothetical protein
MLNHRHIKRFLFDESINSLQANNVFIFGGKQMRKAFLALSVFGLCLTGNTIHGAFPIDLSSQNLTDANVVEAIKADVRVGSVGTTQLNIKLSCNRIGRLGLGALFLYLSSLSSTHITVQSIDLSLAEKWIAPRSQLYKYCYSERKIL